MEFSKNKTKDHQFLEVDEDLRRIGEREAQKEAAKPLCPFGKDCYRRNPSHLQQYRHQTQSQSKPRTALKRGKITDFFGQKHIKKVSIESKEDNSDEKTNKPVEDNPKTSPSKETSPKRRKMWSKKLTSDGITTEDVWSKSDFIGLQTKRNSRYRGSPKYNKLDIFEEESPQKDKTSEKSTEEPKSEKNLKESEDLKVQKNWLSRPTKPELNSKQCNQIIKELFLVEMPKDFYDLWHFCKTLRREKPEDALVETLGLRLVGPYDVLTGRLQKDSIKDKDQILCHWRYFYDLPEFQTIIASPKSGYHLGYFRDTPEEDNPVVVSNNSDKSCLIEGMSDNIFGALYIEIQKLKSKDTLNSVLKQIETKLKEFCSKNKIDLTSNPKLKSRKSKINAKTINSFGLIVPYNKQTEVGYRPLPISDANLKKLFNSILKVDVEARDGSKSLTELKDIIQLITYANDECDFGMGLELGIDLFCFGDPFFHKSALHLLTKAYDLLERQSFSHIIRAHIENRRKGFNLSSI